MKYKVIGWTWFDNVELPNGVATFGAQNAILDEIIKKNYSFTGQDHQGFDACVPVLNNGHKYQYTTRGWGALMAEAHGLTDYYAYSLFAFGSFDDNAKKPDFLNDSYDSDDIEDVENLSETFVLEVTEEESEVIKKTKSITLANIDYIRYIDEHDKILFITPHEEYTLEIKSAEKTATLSEGKMNFIHCNIGSSAKESDRNIAKKLWENLKYVIQVKFI